jgi:HSP20 family protein
MERHRRAPGRDESTKRSIRHPEEGDKDSVKAQMKNGVLTVTLPKIEGEEARKIEIE